MEFRSTAAAPRPAKSARLQPCRMVAMRPHREIPHRDLKRARHEEDLDVEALMRQLTQRLEMASLGTRRVGQEWTITAHFTSKRFYWENHITGEWYWDYFATSRGSLVAILATGCLTTSLASGTTQGTSVINM